MGEGEGGSAITGDGFRSTSFVEAWEHMQGRLWASQFSAANKRAETTFSLSNFSEPPPDFASQLKLFGQLPKLVLGGGGDSITFGDDAGQADKESIAKVFGARHDKLAPEDRFAFLSAGTFAAPTEKAFGPELSLGLNPVERAIDAKLHSKFGNFTFGGHEQKPESFFSKPVAKHNFYEASFTTPGEEFNIGLSTKFGAGAAPEIPGVPGSKREAFERRSYLGASVKMPGETTLEFGATLDKPGDLSRTIAISKETKEHGKFSFSFGDHVGEHHHEDNYGVMATWEYVPKKRKIGGSK